MIWKLNQPCKCGWGLQTQGLKEISVNLKENRVEISKDWMQTESWTPMSSHIQ